MLLNNFTSTMYPKMNITSTTGATSEGGIDSGTEGSISSDLYSETGTSLYHCPFFRGIAFGSGTTPPQKTDYKIENHITTGLTYSGNNTNVTDGVAHWVQTVQNTSTAQITITEVGLFTKQPGHNPGGEYAVFLLTRTVLDNPVVLQPNDVKTFTITIDYNKFIDGTIIQNS